MTQGLGALRHLDETSVVPISHRVGPNGRHHVLHNPIRDALHDPIRGSQQAHPSQGSSELLHGPICGSHLHNQQVNDHQLPA